MDPPEPGRVGVHLSPSLQWRRGRGVRVQIPTKRSRRGILSSTRMRAPADPSRSGPILSLHRQVPHEGGSSGWVCLPEVGFPTGGFLVGRARKRDKISYFFWPGTGRLVGGFREWWWRGRGGRGRVRDPGVRRRSDPQGARENTQSPSVGTVPVAWLANGRAHLTCHISQVRKHSAIRSPSESCLSSPLVPPTWQTCIFQSPPPRSCAQRPEGVRPTPTSLARLEKGGGEGERGDD